MKECTELITDPPCPRRYENTHQAADETEQSLPLGNDDREDDARSTTKREEKPLRMLRHG